MMILWDIGHLTIVALGFCVFADFLPLEDITIHKLSRENDPNVETVFINVSFLFGVLMGFTSAVTKSSKLALLFFRPGPGNAWPENK